MGTAAAIALAILGIMVLVVVHELGHFFAARATGMRVEKLYLFFGKPIWKAKRGETEYGIGSIPLGGYAKITGMNPEEDLDPEVAPRTYYNQPVFKRIVVVAAGPAVNVVLAFVILFGTAFGIEEATGLEVGPITAGSPADGQLEPGDRIVAVDGRRTGEVEPGAQDSFVAGIVGKHRCAGEPREGCRAESAARVVVDRGGERVVLEIRPFYDEQVARTRLGFEFEPTGFRPLDPSAGEAAEIAADQMWFVTSETGKTFAQLFKAEEREKLGSVVGAVEVTRQAIQFDAEVALNIIALVSLSLALINLLPILPLDGGHIFWSLVEKARGRRPSLRTMEQASAIGIMLILIVFAIGLTNDIDRFSDGGFKIR